MTWLYDFLAHPTSIRAFAILELKPHLLPVLFASIFDTKIFSLLCPSKSSICLKEISYQKSNQPIIN